MRPCQIIFCYYNVSVLAWNLSILVLCVRNVPVVNLGAEHRLLGDEFQHGFDLDQRLLIVSVECVIDLQGGSCPSVGVDLVRFLGIHAGTVGAGDGVARHAAVLLVHPLGGLHELVEHFLRFLLELEPVSEVECLKVKEQDFGCSDQVEHHGGETCCLRRSHFLDYIVFHIRLNWR